VANSSAPKRGLDRSFMLPNRRQARQGLRDAAELLQRRCEPDTDLCSHSAKVRTAVRNNPWPDLARLLPELAAHCCQGRQFPPQAWSVIAAGSPTWRPLARRISATITPRRAFTQAVTADQSGEYPFSLLPRTSITPASARAGADPAACRPRTSQPASPAYRGA